MSHDHRPIIGRTHAKKTFHALAVEMAQSGCRKVRHGEDVVVSCESEEEALATLAQVRDWAGRAALALHPDKRHAGNCLREGEGLELLGYRFEGGRRHVRRESLQGFEDELRRGSGRSRGVSMNRIVAELNPMLRGWFACFRHAHRATLGSRDAFIRRRLRGILCQRHGLSYEYHGSRSDHRRCLNYVGRGGYACFAALGLFTLNAAHASASQSR